LHKKKQRSLKGFKSISLSFQKKMVGLFSMNYHHRVIMKNASFFIAFLLLAASAATQAQVYRTGSNAEQLRTLTVYKDGDWKLLPVLNLESDNQVEISFDELSHDYKRYAYRIIHCNADWKKSDMNELEYLDGFSENEINQGDQSVSTLTLYTHYKFSIPNDNVKLKISGNYAVEVFDRETTSEPLLTACFMITEDKVAVEGNVTATTDIDYKQSHQQLNFNIKTLGLRIQQPLTELKVIVQQNHRRDNEVKNLEPMQVNSQSITYEHNKNLIFEAGNEYRRFEMTSYKYSTMGVNKTEYFKPFYNVELFPAEPRLKGYIYDQDQNGRFLIHSQDAIDDLTGSDYFLVHFSIPMQLPIIDGGIYLNGDFIPDVLNADTKMLYNFDRKAYEKSMLLKQGAYNFQYLYFPVKTRKATPLRMEGSYWETENEYQVYVYYRPIGERYDRLIGFRQIQTSY